MKEAVITFKNSYLPTILEFEGMSRTTAWVVWSMIAFLGVIILLFVLSFSKNSYPDIQKKKPSSKSVAPKGFGGFSN